MGYRIITSFLVSILAFATLGTFNQYANAQEMQFEGTPEAVPEVLFVIVPIGDHPNGYIDDVVVEPGASADLAVVIANLGSQPIELKTYKVNAHSGPNGGYSSGAETDEPVAQTTWLDYPTEILSLEPGEQQEISFTVKVPSSAKPGQYISGLVVETAEALPIPGMNLIDHTMGRAISVGILVPGELNYAFEFGQPKVEEQTLRVPITNTGNYLIRPAGELVMKNSQGEVVHNSQVEMGSIYAGLSTTLEVQLPGQLAAGEYSVEIRLNDDASGVSNEVVGAQVTIEEPADPTGVSVVSAIVDPNADDIVFANVDVTLNNGGQQIPASNVSLEVMRDGEQVDSFPLATNQVLLSGENQFVTRYLPADMWQSGEYTFSIKVSAVDPSGGQETILLDEELVATIVVP